jgi:hypothetical protein
MQEVDLQSGRLRGPLQRRRGDAATAVHRDVGPANACRHDKRNKQRNKNFLHDVIPLEMEMESGG